MTTDKIHEILEALDHYDGKYKRAEVNAALEVREEITPHLIGLLENILVDPQKYLDEEHDAHPYALVLLAHWREQKAHEVIVKIFSLPGKLTGDLFGDMKTETLPVALFLTCGSSVDKIRELVLNKNANEYCRGSALKAMAYAAVSGIAERDETINFFATLFTGNEAEPDSYFWCELACCILDLYPEGYMDVIGKACDDGLIYPGYVGMSSFERVLKDGKEKTISRLQEDIERSASHDIHDYMSLWSCYDQKKYNALPPSMPGGSVKKSKAKSKSNKKMAKASRKKNRKK
ncbi:MAG: DUF1186 domain-containing protein [Deltaproteobacteria bacterium]|nr:DUF1186 domain-containing protein [Deltaproteobacteria bacterium]